MNQDSKKRFSNRVENYVKYRPGYPAAIVDFLQQQYNLFKDKQVADVGAGTGISSKLFLHAGYSVTAVEPNKEMRDKAIDLLGRYSNFAAIDGSAEQTGLTAGSIDAIICGQSFHWFNVQEARIEFRRILKNDGIVVLIRNERKTVSDFEQEYDALIIKHARDYTRVDHRNIDHEHINAFYSPQICKMEVFPNHQEFDFSGLEGRLLSSSYMPERNETGYPEMLTDLKTLFEHYQAAGKITIYYETTVYAGRL